MSQIIISIIKYVNIVLICLYAIFSFKATGNIDESQKRKYGIIQNLCNYFILTFSFSTIYLTTYEDKIIIIYFIILVYFIILKSILRILYTNYNISLINNMIFFLTIGFLLLIRLSYTKFINQFSICIIISFIAFVVPKIIEKTVGFRKYGYFYAILGILALGVVLLFGTYVNGAKLNLTIGPFSIQPSEFVKLSYVLFLASVLSKKANFSNIISSGIIAAIHVGILVLSKDLGTALIFCIVYIFIVYIASGKSFYLFGGLLIGSGAVIVAYKLFDHVATRVDAFINPWPLIDDKGYQITQSLFAIATGGNFGMGIYQGMPETIPVVEEDFIFSAICEEYGVLFGIGLILVIISTFIMLIKIAFSCKDNFYKLTVAGFAVLYVFQVFLTIGGAIKFIPSTGVTLPFISYGRSSIVAMYLMFFASVGIEMNQEKVHRIRKNEVTILKTSNKYAYRTTIIFSTLMSFMIVFLFIFSTFKGEAIINNPYNKRYIVLEKKIDKGKILSRTYDVLAETKVDDNGDKYRYYPYGEIFAHVVGRCEYGLDGLEAAYNYDLLEENMNIFSKIFCELNNVKLQGNNIITTLDTNLQSESYEALGDDSGSIIVMDANTGELLVMVSKPSYNPNSVIEDWELISENNTGALLNRAINGLYTPGSTFKLFTMLEYFNEYRDSYKNYEYYCEGITHLSGFSMQCSNKTAHGKCDLKRSLAKSCNCSFVNIGKLIDKNNLQILCDRLLFNTELDFDFDCKNSIFEISNDSTEFDIAQTVIGQGKTLVTPMHMAIIMNAIANEGVAMKPTLVSGISDYAGNIVESFDFVEYKKIFDKNESDILKEYMRDVVVSGTASKLNSEEYTAYGKTGTAQIDNNGNANSWFTGFLKKDNETYVIVVVVENIDENTFPAVNITKNIADAIK